MNSILRKTLVAVAVAGTFAANAATITSVDNDSTTSGIQQVISAQGLAANNGDITTGNASSAAASNELRVQWTPTVTHDDGDVLVVSVTGATIDSSSTVSNVSLLSSTGGTVNNVSTIGVDTEDGEITFSITADTTLVAGTSYIVSGLVLTDLGTSVSFSSVSRLNGVTDFDPASSTTVATVADQWVLGATGDTDLNGVIDVTNSRFDFSSNSDGDSTLDEFDITVTDQSNLLTTTATSVASVVTTTGNFDWTLDDDGDFDTGTVDNTVNAGSATASESLNEDQDELTLTLSGDADDAISTWQFDVPGDVTLIESSYSASTTVSYGLTQSGVTTNGTLNIGDTSIGAWTLGGTSRFVEFMPYGSGIANFFYISNTSSVDAGIELTAYSDTGDAFECGELSVSAAAESVTNLGVAVNEALAACGLGNSGDRLALDFTINANSSAIDLTAGYNSRGDRVLID